MATKRRGFGWVRKLPSKRFQASYAVGPVRHLAAVTFSTRGDAEGHAAREEEAALDSLTLRAFVEDQWLPELDLRPSTRRDYDSLLKNHIYPHLGDRPIVGITKASVRAWWGKLDPDTPRARSKAFQLLHNVMAGALDLDLIETNPVTLPRHRVIRTRRAKKVVPLSLDELNALADAMPERLRMAVLLGCWCALRYGELAELRRSDLDLDAGVLRVSRSVSKVKGGYVVGEPKTDAGVRTVHVPKLLLPDLKKHAAIHAAWGKDGLLFPASNGGHMHSTTFARAFHAAAEAAGRPDATPHTLRHTGASLATDAGAPLPVVMARLGHTTPAMAMLYQHAMPGADEKVAASLSKIGAKGTRA